MKVSKSNLLLAAVLMAAISVRAQQVTESVSTLTRQYRPLFGTKASTISIDFLKNYQAGKTDTSFLLVMSVGNQTTETVGYSVGATVFDMFSGVSVSGHYAINRTAGKVSMDRESFMDGCLRLNLGFAIFGVLLTGWQMYRLPEWLSIFCPAFLFKSLNFHVIWLKLAVLW